MIVERTLYKRTQTGAVQIWYQEIEGDKYRTVSGQIDGKHVTSEWTTATPKNVGRSNETTGEQQALLEVQAEYTKKLAQGNYWESITDIDQERFFEPMLAKKYADDYLPTQEEYEAGLVYSQPKLDGVRSITRESGVWSRKGKPILSVPHVYDAVKHMFEVDQDLILDGEMYGSKLAEDFDKLISLVKKGKPKPADLEESAKMVQLWAYDLPSINGSFSQRNMALKALIDGLNDPRLVWVPTEQVRDQAHLDELNERYILEGYEGQMVRIDREVYENKRTKQLLKRKEFIDEEFIIADILEGEGNRSGMAGRIVYKHDKNPDVTFKSGIKGGVEFYKRLWKDREKYIGNSSEGTVRYFRRTPDDIPRFPVTVAVYEGKRDI